MTDPVTRTELENAALDAATLASLVNGTSGTVTSRLGTVLKTLAQFQNDMAAFPTTVTAVGNTLVLHQTAGSVTNGYLYSQIDNDTARLQWGVAGSGGTSPFTGTSDYSAFIGTSANKWFHIVTGGASSTGDARLSVAPDAISVVQGPHGQGVGRSPDSSAGPPNIYWVGDYQIDQNGQTIVRVTNANAVDSDVEAKFNVSNSAGGGDFGIAGTGFGGAGLATANKVFLHSGATTAGMVIMVGAGALGISAADDITVETGRFASNALWMGATANLFSAKIESSNAGTALGLKTTTAATASQIIWNAAASGDNTFINFYTEASITLRGSITYNRGGGVVAFNTTSDYRLKTVTGEYGDSGDLIDAIPVHFGRMNDATVSRPMFLAHEVAEGGASWAVTGEKDAVNMIGMIIPQQLDEGQLIATMWAELRSLRKRVADLEARP